MVFIGLRGLPGHDGPTGRRLEAVTTPQRRPYVTRLRLIQIRRTARAQINLSCPQLRLVGREGENNGATGRQAGRQAGSAGLKVACICK